MLNEEFRLIPGYTNYVISESGRVFSLKANSPRRLQPHQGPTGYLSVALCGNGKQKRFRVHQLVAASFWGPAPDGLEVNHKDANKLNNHWSNLEYVTHKENMEHAARNGKMSRPSTLRKLSFQDAEDIRRSPKSQPKLAKLYGVSLRAIWNIVNFKTYKEPRKPL